MRKLSTNEKFMIGFILVLLLAIAFTWEDFSKRVRKSLEGQPVEQTEEWSRRGVLGLIKHSRDKKIGALCYFFADCFSFKKDIKTFLRKLSRAKSPGIFN